MPEGAEHRLGEQVNVCGDRVPLSQVRDVTEGLKPSAQTAVQVTPCPTMLPWLHEGETALDIPDGAGHGDSEQLNVKGLNVPKLHCKLGTDGS